MENKQTTPQNQNYKGLLLIEDFCDKCQTRTNFLNGYCEVCGTPDMAHDFKPEATPQRAFAIADPNGASIQRSGDFTTIVRTGDSEIEINSIDKAISEATADLIVNALNNSQSNTIIINELKELRETLDKYWKFNDQRPAASWHDKNDLMDLFDKFIESHTNKEQL
jgi:hypothetical protein